MRRLVTLLIIIILVVVLAVYLFVAPTTVNRIASDLYNAAVLRFTGEVPPIRRLEHTRIRIQEYRNQLIAKSQSLAAEIAASETFQEELEQIYLDLEKSATGTDEENLRDRISYYMWYREQLERLNTLEPKIDQLIFVAKLGSMQKGNTMVDDFIATVEVEILVDERMADMAGTATAEAGLNIDLGKPEVAHTATATRPRGGPPEEADMPTATPQPRGTRTPTPRPTATRSG